jgi:hypothetical protein
VAYLPAKRLDPLLLLWPRPLIAARISEQRQVHVLPELL